MTQSQILIDKVIKFHRYLRIEGWAYNRNVALAEIRIENGDGKIASLKIALGLPWPAVPTAPKSGFHIDALLEKPEMPRDLLLEARFDDGSRLRVVLDDEIRRRDANDPVRELNEEFTAMVKRDRNVRRILDVGGRARSGVLHKQRWKGVEVCCIDIKPDDGVDIVGDAHELSRFVAPNSFDGFYSISVFEHLAMPWKAVLELNKVLRIGALGYVYTHQTIGMHDLPWDYWRYSDSSWAALFNRHTGFEVVKTGLGFAQHIVSFVHTPYYEHAEKTAGFEGSAVIVRKISDANAERLRWDVPLSSIVSMDYPG